MVFLKFLTLHSKVYDQVTGKYLRYTHKEGCPGIFYQDNTLHASCHFYNFIILSNKFSSLRVP